MRSKITLSCCRKYAATAVLAILLKSFSFETVGGLILKYAIFAVLSVLAGYSFEGDKQQPKFYTPYCVCLFLALSIFISYVLPSENGEITLDLVNTVAIVFCAPIFEELFFRGALIDSAMPLFSVFASAFLFAVFHNPSDFFQTFLLGLVLAYIYTATGKLRFPILCHMANNALAVLCMYKDVRVPILILCLAVIMLIYFSGEKDEKKVL